MYVMIDNYDSFVYNLAAYFEELGQQILVMRNDEVTIQHLIALNPCGIIISPGPKNPESAGLSNEIVKYFMNKIPILGVCLGHQVIGYSFGAKIVKGDCPMHGKVTSIHHKSSGLFQDLPDGFKVTRYHSLVVQPDSISNSFTVDAVSEDGAIMGISHKTAPIYGVQFHPEAVLTQYGHELLYNFIRICEEWWCQNEVG